MAKKLSDLVPKEQIVASGGSSKKTIRSIEIDSRSVGDGSLFCALRGEKVDSHLMIEGIRDRLAALVLECPPQTIKNLTNCDRLPAWVQVKSTREVLGPIADVFYDKPTERCRLIGVTGTNGKTSIVSLIASVAQIAGKSPATVGTLGVHGGGLDQVLNHTTPEAHELQGFFRSLVDRGVDLVAMEVSSHGLALRRVDGCRFAAAVYTNLTLDHLDYHQDMESYFMAKRRLFVDFRPAFSVINGDDLYGRRLSQELSTPVLTYSVDNRRADLWCDDLAITHEGIRGLIRTGRGACIRLESSLIGRYNVSNLLAAAGVCLSLDIPSQAIEEGIRTFSGVPGRLERIDTSRQTSVFVDYAHTPDALSRVLQTVGGIAKGRLWVVFGCGGDRDRSKRPVMGRIAVENSDVVIITNDNPRSEDPLGIVEDILGGIPLESQRASLEELISRGGCWVEPDRQKAIETALEAATPGDMIVVAGKGHEDYQIVGGVKSPFDDRQVVKSWGGRKR